MKLTLNTAEVERAIASLRAKSPLAIVRSMNRGMGAGRTQLVRDTARALKLKVGTVRDRTSVGNATTGQLRATIMASAKPVPAIEFGARGPDPSRGLGRGITTKLPSRRFPRAFFAVVGKGQHRGVFERVGKKRLPIREIKGPSVWFVAMKHLPAAAARALEQTLKTLQHEISRILPTGGPK